MILCRYHAMRKIEDAHYDDNFTIETISGIKNQDCEHLQGFPESHCGNQGIFELKRRANQ